MRASTPGRSFQSDICTAPPMRGVCSEKGGAKLCSRASPAPAPPAAATTRRTQARSTSRVIGEVGGCPLASHWRAHCCSASAS